SASARATSPPGSTGSSSACAESWHESDPPPGAFHGTRRPEIGLAIARRAARAAVRTGPATALGPPDRRGTSPPAPAVVGTIGADAVRPGLRPAGRELLEHARRPVAVPVGGHHPSCVWRGDDDRGRDHARPDEPDRLRRARAGDPEAAGEAAPVLRGQWRGGGAGVVGVVGALRDRAVGP